MIKSGDNGLFTDIELISYAIVKEADSIGRLFSKNISIINYEDAGFKKPIISGCIKLGLSSDIDEIVNEKYKIVAKGFKGKNKMDAQQ
jgi:hypothetical protein